ncbi:accessory factor UbiK family protein [Modicisalibacter coralii]|uniref:accessory factor UbiK family protein n=1 Tax=Modicisalibacter coralii TaxID=2304602 RepID=UPI00100B91BF|nr:accessory factor UbiK family protein [Halomonas coralii]
MISNDRISRLAQQLGERLQDASHAPEEIQRNVHNVMRGAFDRMELVTREDFDILMDVLQRTRARVEALEKQVATLEASLDADSSVPASPAAVAADTAAPPAPEAEDAAPQPPRDDTDDTAER